MAVSKEKTEKLPSDWVVVNLGEIVDIKYGKGLPTKNLTEAGYPVFGANGIIGFYTEYLYEDEQVLISCRGAYSGKINWSPSKCFITNNSLVLELPSEFKDIKKYLFYALQSADKSKIVTGSAQPQVTINNAVDLKIPLAPINQQKRIVAEIEKQFSRLDEAVDNLKRVKVNLKRYKASVLKAAVEGKLTEEWRKKHPNVEPADKLLERILAERRKKWEEAELAKMRARGKVPKDDKWKKRYKEPIEPILNYYSVLPLNWGWATVEQLASDEPRSIQSGPFGSNLKHSEFQDKGKFVIGIDNVQDGDFSIGSEHRISEEKFKELEKYAAHPGDVLITVMATVGRTCVVPENLEPAIITKHVYRISSDRKLVYPDYLHLALWGGACVRKQMFGQVIGQTRPGLNGTIIKRLVIPVPPLEEQLQIIEAIKGSISIIDNIHPEIEKAKRRSEQLRQSILQKAFSGELSSQDADDEPVEKLLNRILLKQDKAGKKVAKKGE